MTHDNVTDIVERIAPLLEELETGQDCAEYAYAKGKGFQAMTYCPEAFEALKELPEYITTLRKQLENAREALRPFALAAQKGSNVYAGVQMAMKDRPDLFSYSTAYIDAGRSTAHSHLSWSDYVEAREAYEALKGQPC